MHEGRTPNLHKAGTSDGVGPWKTTGTEDPGLGTEGGGCMRTRVALGWGEPGPEVGKSLQHEPVELKGSSCLA